MTNEKNEGGLRPAISWRDALLRINEQQEEISTLKKENEDLRLLQPERNSCGHPSVALVFVDDVGSSECSICQFETLKEALRVAEEVLERLVKCPVRVDHSGMNQAEEALAEINRLKGK